MKARSAFLKQRRTKMTITYCTGLIELVGSLQANGCNFLLSTFIHLQSKCAGQVFIITVFYYKTKSHQNYKHLLKIVFHDQKGQI